MVINSKHYQKLTIKQTFDIENTLFSEDYGIDMPIQILNLHAYDELMEVASYE